MDDEERKPSESMLNFIRVLLSRSMGDKRAKSLPDDEIAWIAPLVEYELGKLKKAEEMSIILYYGLYGRKPLSLEEVGEKVTAEEPLTRDQAGQVIREATNTVATWMIRLKRHECNLLSLLAGTKGATAVLDAKRHASLPALCALQNAIDDLKIVQFKCNVQSFIFEKSLEAIQDI